MTAGLVVTAIVALAAVVAGLAFLAGIWVGWGECERCHARQAEDRRRAAAITGATRRHS